MSHLRIEPWSPEGMALWVKDRQSGSQCEADKKVYAQPKNGYATYHWLWILGHKDGIERDFTRSNTKETDLFRHADGTWSWR